MTLKKVNNNSQLFKARKGDFPPDANTNISSRRNLLRGVLMAGCGLLTPDALFGGEVQTGSKPANSNARSSLFTHTRYRAAVATGSQQSSVHYQALPNGKQQCGSCDYFVVASNACKRVDGRISATGCCNLWASKS